MAQRRAEPAALAHEPARGGALRRVINATGVVLHANLGRAPLSAAARAAVVEAAGYASVGIDLDTGRRASRDGHLDALAARACGTEAAAVVTNGAAALVLTLATLARGRQVVVSRGELLELGGSYRLPDMVGAAGAALTEVGTTNHTRIDDYRAATGTDTALLLKVRRAGYTVGGSQGEVALPDLVRLGRETGLPVVHHLGSGLLHDVAEGPLAGEPSVGASVAAGADLVLFSGDKLLGGPQSGIVAGRADLVLRLLRHPLARAVQVDKLQRAALEATLVAHLDDPRPPEVPVVAMLTTPLEALEERASRMAAQLGEPAAVTLVEGMVGSGVHPEVPLRSWAVALRDADADRLARELRAGDPPLVPRVDEDRVLIDLRTVPPSLDGEVVDLVIAARERLP